MGIVVKSFDVGQGDFFLIKVFDAAGNCFNLVVDCGKTNMSGDLKDALNEKPLNGIVVTHVDNDHIVGVIDLLENCGTYDFINNVFIIYNKYDETLITYDKGNKLYEVIRSRLSQKMLIKSYARNYNRENKVIERRREKEQLPVHILSKIQRGLMSADMLEKDHVYITMLSPNIEILKKFMRNWKKVTESSVKIPEDSDLKNQSSITFLLEFNEKKVLMLGDGIVKEIYEIVKEFKGVEKIDYIKLSHHGARNSNEGIEKFADTFSCKKYGVTIKREQTGETRHPDRDVIKRLFERGCQIYTSTDYECTDPTDWVHKIEKKSEIGV